MTTGVPSDYISAIPYLQLKEKCCFHGCHFKIHQKRQTHCKVLIILPTESQAIFAPKMADPKY